MIIMTTKPISGAIFVCMTYKSYVFLNRNNETQAIHIRYE